MAFVNDNDLSTAIQAFLQTVAHGRLSSLWTEAGPTELAASYINDGSPLSHGEHLLLQVAFDLWNGQGKATLDGLLSVLDDTNLAAVLDLVLIARPNVEGHMVK